MSEGSTSPSKEVTPPTAKLQEGLEIPIDILFLIFAYLPSATLSVCCRLSRRTHSTAFDALYRHIKPTSRNILDLIFRLSQPLLTAASAEDAPLLLATKVHTFVLSEAKSSFEMYLGNIQEFLPKLTKLKVLVLDLPSLSGWVLPKVHLDNEGASEKAENGPPFKLDIFHCSMQYDTILHEFLQSQPSIHTLIVRAPVPHDPHAISKDSGSLLPNITFLYAPWKLAAALVPGRPISDLTTWHLSMNSARDADQSLDVSVDSEVNSRNEFDISCLSSSTAEGGLKRLFINWSFLSVPGPEKLGQVVPKLSRLSIDADGVDPSDETSQVEIVEYLTNLLPFTKSLESIFIRFHPLRAVVPCQEIDFSDMVTSIYKSSKMLKNVVITFLGMKARYVCRKGDSEEEWCIVNR